MKKIPKKQVLERINFLFKEAENASSKDSKIADKYVKSARKLSMKHKIKLPLNLKRGFCRNCYVYITPGKNVRIRTQRGHVVYYCLNCKKHTRIPYK